MNFKEALIAHLQGERVEVLLKKDGTKALFDSLEDHSIGYLIHHASTAYEFRLAPCVLLVNGVEVPAPEKKMLRDEKTYFIPSVGNDDLFSEKCNYNPDLTKLHIERGLVYLNKEDAIARAKAMIITKEKV